jgi:hypothetical protein
MKNIRLFILICVFLTSCPGSLAQQVIEGQNGSVFMEEEPLDKQKAGQADKAKERKIPIDLSNVGVPVDKGGRIVPLLQSEPGGVMQEGTSLEVSRTPSMQYLPNYYLNAAGQKIDAFGNLLPPGTYLPNMAYPTGPWGSARFGTQPGENSSGASYRGTSTFFGGGGGVNGTFGRPGRFSGGGWLAPQTTTESSGTMTPIFPQGQQ